jgi:divalent metal cation (Fe/Co/Zn/Cd) transporter
MKRISTLFEIIVSAALLFLGLYMLYEASSNKSTNEAAILIGGAVCFTLSIMILVSAVKSLLWHRRMLSKARPWDEGGQAAIRRWVASK